MLSTDMYCFAPTCIGTEKRDFSEKGDFSESGAPSCCQILHCALAIDLASKGPRRISPGPAISGRGLFAVAIGIAGCGVTSSSWCGSPAAASPCTSCCCITSWLASIQDSCRNLRRSLYQFTSSCSSSLRRCYISSDSAPWVPLVLRESRMTFIYKYTK